MSDNTTYIYRRVREDDNVDMLRGRTRDTTPAIFEGRGDYSICERMESVKDRDPRKHGVTHEVVAMVIRLPEATKVDRHPKPSFPLPEGYEFGKEAYDVLGLNPPPKGHGYPTEKRVAVSQIEEAEARAAAAEARVAELEANGAAAPQEGEAAQTNGAAAPQEKAPPKKPAKGK